MKSLFLLAAIAGTAYVSYSYSTTEGKSCLVCPMTGEPVFTSAEQKSGSCCAGATASLMTGLAEDSPSCCSKASGSCCPTEDAESTLTSAAEAACEGSCEKGCCKDKANAEQDDVDVTETPKVISPESSTPEVAEVVAELTEAE